MRCASVVILGVLLLGACATPETEEQAAPEPDVAQAPEPDIRGEEVAYEVDGVQLNGYLAYDAAQTGERPGVLVVHEWWGHNDYARERARMLAEMGYTALAVDMYGDGKLAEHPEDAQKFMMEVLGQMDVGVERFRVARSVLEKHDTTDASRTAAIGYCFGGAVVLHMARLGDDLEGVASFHGDLSTRNPAEPGTVQARVLVLHGADDPFVPAESIEAFKAEMEGAGADMKFIAYPGAVHSFTNPAATAVGEEFGMPLAYQQEADELSWAELEGFLADSFGG
jgi:dienelactone hydrolase